jgi:hypothetical protein
MDGIISDAGPVGETVTFMTHMHDVYPTLCVSVFAIYQEVLQKPWSVQKRENDTCHSQ